MLELRILSGARSGQVDRFEKSVIVVGRHGTVDMRFSPEQDLDVSGRHAEIRESAGVYSIQDVGSTNGTFVNGKRVEGTVTLHHGDRVRFGANGPEVEVQTGGPKITPTRSNKAMTTPGSTEVRIAAAVQKQTAGLKRMMAAVLVLVIVGGGMAYYFARRDAQQKAQALAALKAQNDSVAMILQGGRSTDTALLKQVIALDWPTIHKQNSPAVVILVSEIDGKAFAGTGFSIATNGTLLTNRHNVRDEDGHTASRVAVKFTNTKAWLPAHIVKISDDPAEDLALIKLDGGGSYPVVQGVTTGARDAAEGTAVVTIGFPLGYDTPMEGEGNDFIAKSTLNPGTISKRTSAVLQIDSYAAHGSSGSPVFNTRGEVVGVVYGGAPGGGGRIVYAVPPDKVAAFIPAEYRGIVKD